MSVRRLTPADYRTMPWKNGGGTTTEIAIAPEGASFTGFLYRVSIAEVASDGPFSPFVGFDRHIVLLAGAGMTLDCGAHGRIALVPFEPQTFSGDWDVAGALVAGPVRDFNLIADRALAASSLEVRLLAARETIPCDAGSVCLIHLPDSGDTIVADEPVEVEAGRVVIARIALVA